MRVEGWRRPAADLGLAAVLTTAATLLALPLIALQAAFPHLEGRLEVTGAQAPIEILRDAHGIPHIFAAHERDAWFGLGFVHAQDRFASMEFTRRAGQGRLAEVMGARFLAADRRHRTLGYARAAETAARSLAPATRALPITHKSCLDAIDGRDRWSDPSPASVRRIGPVWPTGCSPAR